MTIVEQKSVQYSQIRISDSSGDASSEAVSQAAQIRPLQSVDVGPIEADLVAAKLSGLKGALRVYEAARETEGAKGLDRLLELREQGTLKQYVEQGVQSCRDSGSINDGLAGEKQQSTKAICDRFPAPNGVLRGI